mgnify:CR=1 FL=1
MKPQAIGLSMTQQHPEMSSLLPKYAEACKGYPWVTGGWSVDKYKDEIEALGGMVVSGNMSLVRAYLEAQVSPSS